MPALVPERVFKPACGAFPRSGTSSASAAVRCDRMPCGETASLREPKSSAMNKMPDPPAITVDPMLQQQEQQAQRDSMLALQDRAKDDTASVMARFGSLAAFAQAAKG